MWKCSLSFFFFAIPCDFSSVENLTLISIVFRFIYYRNLRISFKIKHKEFELLGNDKIEIIEKNLFISSDLITES